MGEPKIKQRCNVALLPSKDPEFEVIPCTKKFRLKPEDEISLDSIISHLLSQIEPSELTFQRYRFDVPAKDLLNEKKAFVFDENLYISKLKDNNCQMNEEMKLLLERELQEIGTFKVSVEESYDGYVVFSKSKMRKGKNCVDCGHWVRGKYDDRLKLVCEKRAEYDIVDNVKIEKALEARIIEDKLIAKRLVSINRETERFKTVVNMKGRDDVFLCDAGILLLMRYLIITNFKGNFNYFSMNVFGKIMRCQMTVHSERKRIKVFHRTFNNAIRVVNTQYFNSYTNEVSETYYTPSGKMILHFWHGYPYIIHETKGFIKPVERILPKLEIMWRCHNGLLDKYRLRRDLNYKAAMDFFNKHPNLSDFLYDYLVNVLKFKPSNILDFTVRYFQKFRRLYP